MCILGGEIAPSSMLLNPCKYLDFERNVWSVTNSYLTPLSLPIVSQIATLLVKVTLAAEILIPALSIHCFSSCDFQRVIILQVHTPE